MHCWYNRCLSIGLSRSFLAQEGLLKETESNFAEFRTAEKHSLLSMAKRPLVLVLNAAVPRCRAAGALTDAGVKYAMRYG